MNQIGHTLPNIYQQHQRTKDAIQRLEEKLTSQLQQRPLTEEALLFSHPSSQPPAPPPKHKNNTFKVFSKEKKESKPLSEVELEGTEDREKEKERFSRSQGGQLIEEVEAIEALVRKKLALKEERVGQLERELTLEEEEKLHLYQINCQLEQELEQLEQSQKEEQCRISHQQQLLERELSHLKKEVSSKRAEGKRLKREQQLLRDTLRNANRNRRGCIQAQLQGSKREKEEECLRGLVVELDRLREMVRRRMGRSKSKTRIRMR